LKRSWASSFGGLRRLKTQPENPKRNSQCHRRAGGQLPVCPSIPFCRRERPACRWPIRPPVRVFVCWIPPGNLLRDFPFFLCPVYPRLDAGVFVAARPCFGRRAETTGAGHPLGPHVWCAVRGTCHFWSLHGIARAFRAYLWGFVVRCSSGAPLLLGIPRSRGAPKAQLAETRSVGGTPMSPPILALEPNRL